MFDLERTPAGLHMVIPGCERRTLAEVDNPRRRHRPGPAFADFAGAAREPSECTSAAQQSTKCTAEAVPPLTRR
jgi:hypothetical protein